jgi:hypothetical protein
MRHWFPLIRTLKSALVVIVPSALLLALPGLCRAQSVIPVAAFRSVTLQNGGVVVLRHGSRQQVTVLKGAADCVEAAIADGNRLVIDHRHGCEERHGITVEIVTPHIDGLSVMDGGTIRTSGGFPRQTDIAVAVEDGGTVDLRSMVVDRVTAAVHDGGRIMARPQDALTAQVARGGAVTYWGSPRVTSAVDGGGVIARGNAADLDKPLDELGITNAPVPPVPPVAPVAPKKARGTI